MTNETTAQTDSQTEQQEQPLKKNKIQTRKEKIIERNNAERAPLENKSASTLGQAKKTIEASPKKRNELVVHKDAAATEKPEEAPRKKIKRPIHMTAYDILNIRRNAPQTDVFAAFRKLALQWHPDRHPVTNRAQATQCFNIVNDAYESLKTRERRAAYDKSLLREAVFNAQYAKNQRFRRANDNKNNKHITRIALNLLGTMFWPFEKQTSVPMNNRTTGFTNIDL